MEFKDYKVRYRPGLDLVLKGLTFTVNSGEKVFLLIVEIYETQTVHSDKRICTICERGCRVHQCITNCVETMLCLCPSISKLK